ncbi:ATP-binding protein [Dechloromonas sp. ZY10]|uniref:ATP-binding protein n=1 Tax=Dechloromonas aquae TaxID=2664436 RepID=UPI003526ECE8
MPNSLLARTFLLLALLALLTTTAWLSLFRHLDAEPRARESAQLAASTVNLIRAALFAATPEKRPGLFAELSQREGLRLLPAEPGDQVEAMPEGRFFQLLQGEISARLGPQTRIAAAVDGVPGFWISFRLDEQDDDEYWLVLPRDRARRDFTRQWLLWGLLATGLSLAIAWLIASRISRPLKALAASARLVGSGQQPPQLPETGAEELRQLAAAFNAMAGDLARHEKDRSEVLAGISHDLRTPLTRLRLEAEMSIADSAARDAAVADIAQMETVIAQFMDYARSEAGETPFSCALSPLLATLVSQRRALGQDVHGELEELPASALRPHAILRAVANLLDNAWKYAHDSDGRSSRIDLLANLQAGEIRIEVADRGPGIPESEVERLKRPFTRLEDARTDALGAGLGLAIVERVARLHGGRLELLPRAGGGLRARLCLPLRETDSG